MEHASVYYLSVGTVQNEESVEMVILERLEPLIPENIKRGDVIVLSLPPYIFAWSHLIYNGSRLQFIDIDGDYWENCEYKCLSEFPIHYWDGILPVTSVYLEFDKFVSEPTENNVEHIGLIPYYPFEYQGISYRVVADFDVSLELTPQQFVACLGDIPIFTHTPHYLQNLDHELLVPSDNVIYCRIDNPSMYS